MKSIDMDNVYVVVGDSVIVSEPSHGDLWNNEFTGTVVGIKSNNKVLIVVEDQDGNCFDVECEKVSKE